MIYKISHTFAPEIFLPWCSIAHNIDFSRSQDTQPVMMSDGTQAEVISVNEIHILSEAAEAISQRLYQVSAMTLLKEWYKRLPVMTSMFFVNIRLKKYEARIDATAISEEVDTSGTGEPD